MAGVWDEAARKHYGFEGVDGLERAWLEAIRKAAPKAGARA